MKTNEKQLRELVCEHPLPEETFTKVSHSSRGLSFQFLARMYIVSDVSPEIVDV